MFIQQDAKAVEKMVEIGTIKEALANVEVR